MSQKPVNGNSALEKIDEGRRAYLRKLAAGTAFVVPMVASFSTDGLRFNKAEAGTLGSNLSSGPLGSLIKAIINWFQSIFGPP
jgi:hypothetical protein